MGPYCVTGEGTYRDHEIWKVHSRPKFGGRPPLPRQKNSWALSMREPRRVAMPNVWAGTTLDGVQCRLNSEPAGLVAHVGKGGKKISRRVARPSTSLFECVAAMERVLDRSQTPLPSPADLHAILCGLPLLWLEAGQRFESGE